MEVPLTTKFFLIQLVVMPKLLAVVRWKDVNHTTRGANALRIYGNSRFNQSKYPYYTPFFTGNEISTLMQLGGQAGTSGYGGPNNQGYRDSTSSYCSMEI